MVPIASKQCTPPQPSRLTPGAAAFVKNVLISRQLSFDPGGEIGRIAPQATVRIETRPDALAPLIGRADIIFGNPPPHLLAGQRRLKWLQILSAGFDEYASLADTGVMLTTAHGVHSEALAHHVLLAMLTFARGQLLFAARQREARWDRDPAVPFQLAGQTVGFIGFGAIGQALLPFTRQLGMRAIAVRREAGPCPKDLVSIGMMRDLDVLLPACDHVVITMPLTAETRDMMDARRIRLIKPGAFFYNVSRGALVDEEALYQRLAEGSLGGVALDVFREEPLPTDSPWWTTPNAIITPHIAGHFRELPRRTFELFLENLAAFVEGRRLHNVADFARGY